MGERRPAMHEDELTTNVLEEEEEALLPDRPHAE